MSKTNMKAVAIRMGLLSACLVSCAWVWNAPAAEEKWQSAAKWCTRDVEAPGAAYRAACKDGKYDQFDSVITCQQDAKNEKFVRTVSST